MDDRKYASLLTNVLERFRKPGEALQIAEIYKAKEDDNVECGLCGWPRTSTNPRSSRGLRNVYVLKNLSTRWMLEVGCNCAENYQKYIQEGEPAFAISGLAKAQQKFQQTRKTTLPQKSQSNYRKDFYGEDPHENTYEERDLEPEEGNLESVWHYYYVDDEYVDPSENEGPDFRDDYYFDEE